jgi:NADH:quinone reductase (non-electrogenic)
VERYFGMVLVTKITKLFQIRHPIIQVPTSLIDPFIYSFLSLCSFQYSFCLILQGGMHFVGYAPLAAAVANAGGLGLVTALTQKSPELLLKELQLAKSLLRPGCQGKVGANLTILPMFSEVNYDAYVDAIIESGVDVVETAGRPPGEFITRFKQHGIKIIHKCVTTRHAKAAEKMGADAISLDGFECGGHPGEEDIGNYVLQAMGARDLTVPFVTSGGVSNGRQLAASLALGASGVNLGTRFMATREAPIHENIKSALVSGGSGDTTLVMRSVRNTERVFKNPVAMKVREIETEFPGDFSKIHALVKGENYRKSFQETGDTQSSVWSCGTGLALIDDIPSCEELIERMVSEAEGAIREANQQIA